MSAIFFVLLVVILGGLVGLALQNLSLSISLVFLGLRSQPIPLGFLILGAITAGIVTGLIVISLLNLSNYLTRRRSQGVPTKGPQLRPPWQTAANPKPAYTQSNSADSWDGESYDEPANRAGSYEVEQQPKTTYQSGSTYSYSYRDNTQTGVGRPEAVVDAEYRVVTPPNSSDEIDDDYGFDDDFEDEEFKDDNPPNPRH